MFLLKFLCSRQRDGSGTSNINMIEQSQEIISKVPAGVSGTALAASLLRDGWSVSFSLSVLVQFISVSTLWCIYHFFLSCSWPKFMRSIKRLLMH